MAMTSTERYRKYLRKKKNRDKANERNRIYRESEWMFGRNTEKKEGELCSTK